MKTVVPSPFPLPLRWERVIVWLLVFGGRARGFAGAIAGGGGVIFQREADLRDCLVVGALAGQVVDVRRGVALDRVILRALGLAGPCDRPGRQAGRLLSLRLF